MENQFPQRQTVVVTHLEFGKILRHFLPHTQLIASGILKAVIHQTHHPLEVVQIGNGSVVPVLAAGDEFHIAGNVVQQLHFPFAAVGARHGMIGIPALLPGRGGRGINKACQVRFHGQLRRDLLGGVFRRETVADHAAVVPLAVFAFHIPAVTPAAVFFEDDLIGPGSVYPVRVPAFEILPVSRIHDILINVVAAGKDSHFIDFSDFLRVASGAPEDMFDAGSLHFFRHFAGNCIPVPDVHRTGQPCCGGDFLFFFTQCFEDALFLRILAVALGHADISARPEEAVSQTAFIAKFAQLRIPLRKNCQLFLVAVNTDAAIVRCFNDGGVAGLSVCRSPESHADTMAAVGDQIPRFDRFVFHRIGDAFVQGNDQIFTRLGTVGRRIGQPAEWRVRLIERVQCNDIFRLVGIQLQSGSEFSVGCGIQQFHGQGSFVLFSDIFENQFLQRRNLFPDLAAGTAPDLGGQCFCIEPQFH